MIRQMVVALVGVLSIGLAAGSAAEPRASTFELDGLSFVSFGGGENYSLPVGGSIVFRFGEPEANGTVNFTIRPADVSLPSVDVGGRSMSFRLVRAAEGQVVKEDGTYRVEFSAVIGATSSGGGEYRYGMLFTTDRTEATSRGGEKVLAVDGMDLVPGAGAMQIVGATTSKADAYPAGGEAVYAVLSGAFQDLPELP